MSLDTPDLTHVVLPVSGIKHVVAIDFDPVDRFVYWTDDENCEIKRSRMDGTGMRPSLHRTMRLLHVLTKPGKHVTMIPQVVLLLVARKQKLKINRDDFWFPTDRFDYRLDVNKEHSLNVLCVAFDKLMSNVYS